jgi:hypothetical protein
VSEQDRKALLEALQRERLGYAREGLADRVAEVDAQIRLLGGEPPAKKAKPAAKAAGRAARS